LPFTASPTHGLLPVLLPVLLYWSLGEKRVANGKREGSYSKKGN